MGRLLQNLEGLTGSNNASHPMMISVKFRRGDTLVQGKEQWLCFAGVDVKRYPMSKVRETQKMVCVVRGHQRADILKP